MQDKIVGTLQQWNDERGFGFIEAAGQPGIFVHIKAFKNRRRRPAVGDVVIFAVELDERGKKRAREVEFPRQARKPVAAEDHPAQWGTATLAAIPALIVFYVVLDLVWKVPRFMPLVYFVSCTIAITLYVADKVSAVKGGWRVPEKTLHMVGLAGGWPGALIAQQFLRHKTVKAEFRATFWGTAILNGVLLAVLAYTF